MRVLIVGGGIGGLAAVLLAALQCIAASFARAAPADAQNPAAIVWPTTGWQVSTPEEQGMDAGGLAQLVDTVGTYKQDSLLIIRHGRIAAEAWYAPYAAGIRHDLRSVTKSFTGTLTAIEVQSGLLDSVDHPIVDLFADKQIANLDDNKRAMTVQSLLDMTSGIEWQEKAYTPDETVMRMYKSPDHTAFVLDQPMAHAPGTQFYYDSGNPYVLSAVITRKTGQNAFEFAKKQLFAPLGVSNVYWNSADAQNVTDGESGLHVMPRDMAKLGYLYLHDGNWDGRQIIPPSWAARVREGKVAAVFGLHYANLWWSQPEKGAFMALGRHSQIILVLPKLDIVAVMTGILRDDEHYPLNRLIDDITGAVRSDGPLPADPVALSLLAASIHQAATERPSPVGDTPELATAISGKTYRFTDNELHVETLILNLVDANPSWKITTRARNEPVVQHSGPIGLDGVYRTGEAASYGINAVKGRWMGGQTFAIDRRILGNSETQLWTLVFDGDKVDFTLATTDGYKVEVRGEANQDKPPGP